MRVAIRVDASETIGGGHAMRCLALADTLSDQGADVIFVAAFMPEALEKRIAGAGHELLRIPSSPELAREGQNWEEPPASSKAQLADCEATSVAVGHVQWLVVDHYLLDCRWQAKARSFADRILVIDDLANRPHDCDILLDQTAGRSPDDYRHKVPGDATILAGATFALLRPEFARDRPAAIERRKEGGTVGRVLVSMGTADPRGITAGIVEQLVATVSECAIDVVLSAQATSLDQVRELADANSAISVHLNSDRMADLMCAADLAVGAAGTTSWERCCLGLPTLLLVFADNQRASAEALSAVGAALVVERPDQLAQKMDEIISGSADLSLMSAAAFAITDGRGASRVVQAMSGTVPTAEIALRPAQLSDSERLWLWRNDPVTRAQSRNTKPITWETHSEWLASVLARSGGEILIAECGGTAIGTIRFDPLPDGAQEVSIAVAPEMRGRGWGAAMLRTACGRVGGVIYASVREENPASRRLFEACGFAPIEREEPGFLRYALVAQSDDGSREAAA